MGRLLSLLLVAACVLAVAQTVLVALLVLFGIVLLWGFLTRPAETVGFLLFCAWMTLMQSHALVGLAVLAFAIYLEVKLRRATSEAQADTPAPLLPPPPP